MFYRGVIHTYDLDTGGGEINIKEQNLTVSFNLKDLPNSTISPQIGERVKFIIVDENNQKFAKYIIRLDNKNANIDHAVRPYQDTQSIETSNTMEKERFHENAQKPKYIKKNITRNNATSESKTVENQKVIQNNEQPQNKIDPYIQQNKSVSIARTKHSKTILQEAETRLLQKIMSSNIEHEQVQTLSHTKSHMEQNLKQDIAEDIDLNIDNVIHTNIEKSIENNLEKNLEKSSKPKFEQNIDLNNVQNHVEHSDNTIPNTATSEGSGVAPEFELNYKALNRQQLNSTDQPNINDPIENDHLGDEQNSPTIDSMPEFELNFEKLSNLDEPTTNEYDFETSAEPDSAQKKVEHTEAFVEEFELDFSRLASPQIQSDNGVDLVDSSKVLSPEDQDNEVKESSAQPELVEFELNFSNLNINQISQTNQINEADLNGESEDDEKHQNNSKNAELYSELLNVDFELNFEKLNTDLVILEGENSPDRSADDESQSKVLTNEPHSRNLIKESIVIEESQKLDKPAPPVLVQANMVNAQDSSDNKNFPYQANIKKFERLKETIGIESVAETNEKLSFQGQVKAPDPTIVADIQNTNKVMFESKVNHSVHKQDQLTYDSNLSGKKKIKKKKSEKIGLKVLMVIIGLLILINGSLWGYQRFQQYKADQDAKLKIYMIEQEKKIEEQRRSLGKLPDKILSDEALDDLLGKDRNK